MPYAIMSCCTFVKGSRRVWGKSSFIRRGRSSRKTVVWRTTRNACASMAKPYIMPLQYSKCQLFTNCYAKNSSVECQDIHRYIINALNEQFQSNILNFYCLSYVKLQQLLAVTEQVITGKEKIKSSSQTSPTHH
jgi:hypothetical protein